MALEGGSKIPGGCDGGRSADINNESEAALQAELENREAGEALKGKLEAGVESIGDVVHEKAAELVRMRKLSEGDKEFDSVCGYYEGRINERATDLAAKGNYEELAALFSALEAEVRGQYEVNSGYDKNTGLYYHGTTGEKAYGLHDVHAEERYNDRMFGDVSREELRADFEKRSSKEADERRTRAESIEKTKEEGSNKAGNILTRLWKK